MKQKIQLVKIAHARSGDKGDKVNIGVIARRDGDFDFLRTALTAERVKEYFKDICKGSVVRYELPNIGALNFVLDSALDGGGTVSLRSDAQGKTYAAALLRMELER